MQDSVLLDGKLQEYQAAFQQADSSGNGKLGACCTGVSTLTQRYRPTGLMTEGSRRVGLGVIVVVSCARMQAALQSLP